MRISLQQAKAWGIEIPSDVKKKPSGEMNKTESRFAEMCRQVWCVEYAFEATKFRLANKTWLTIDFRVTLERGQNVFVECKARDKNGRALYKDDAIVKLKVTAETHPFPFYLASYGRTGWDFSLVPSRKYGHLWRDLVTPW